MIADERIKAQVEADIAMTGMQDNVKTPDDEATVARYRRLLTANCTAEEMLQKP